MDLSLTPATPTRRAVLVFISGHSTPCSRSRVSSRRAPHQRCR
jgi:hypothetical protein